jgi:hypothetical protein
MPVPEPTPSTTATRTECDSLGAIAVPAEHYWGAQTQRSLTHFAIGDERMPVAVIHAYALVKKAAGATNADAGRLDRHSRMRSSQPRRRSSLAGSTPSSRCPCGRRDPARRPT